jgi:hypothetical protein
MKKEIKFSIRNTMFKLTLAEQEIDVSCFNNNKEELYLGTVSFNDTVIFENTEREIFFLTENLLEQITACKEYQAAKKLLLKELE